MLPLKSLDIIHVLYTNTIVNLQIKVHKLLKKVMQQL